MEEQGPERIVKYAIRLCTYSEVSRKAEFQCITLATGCQHANKDLTQAAVHKWLWINREKVS